MVSGVQDLDIRAEPLSLLLYMGNKTLRRKISLFILIPLILGTIITAVISWLPIYLQYPNWILKVIVDMENDQGKVLMEVSLHLSALTAGALQIPSNYILMVAKLIEDYYDNAYTTRPGFNGLSNYQSAIELINERVMEPNHNLSMWYLNPFDTTVEELNATDRENLETSAIFDAFARPVLTNYTKNRIKTYYHVFADGLLYETPAVAMSFLEEENPYPDDSNCTGHSTKYYDPLCRPFYTAVVNAADNYLAIIPDPYINIRTGEVGHTACKGVWSGGTLRLAACVDFEIYDIEAIISNLFVAHGSYAFALNTDGSVFFHPKASNESSVQSILQLEFDSETSEEAQKFHSEVVPLFHSSENSFTTYQKNEATMLIAITPVYVMLAISHFYVHLLSVGVVMPEHELRERFEVLQNDSDHIMIVEVVIFAAVLACIVFLGWL